jgi:hypothetical protein
MNSGAERFKELEAARGLMKEAIRRTISGKRAGRQIGVLIRTGRTLRIDLLVVFNIVKIYFLVNLLHIIELQDVNINSAPLISYLIYC